MISTDIARQMLEELSEEHYVRANVTDDDLNEALERDTSWESELAFAIDKIRDVIHDSDLVGDTIPGLYGEE